MHNFCYDNEVGEKSSLDVVKLFIQIDPDCVRNEDEEGYLPIHHAAGNKSAQFCKLLIDAYPESVKTKAGSDKDLPLHMACKYSGQCQTLKFLFEQHPEGISEKTSGGLYPLHVAVYYARPRANKI